MLSLNRALCFLLLLALGFASDPTGASPVLDQSSWPATTEVWIDNDANIDQTFTVGLSGQLTTLELWVVRVPDTGAELFLASAAFGTAWIHAMDSSTPAGLVAIDLTSLGLQVTAGDVVHFDVEHDDVLVLGATDGVYSAGDLVWSCGLDGCINPAGLSEPFVDIPPFPPFSVTLPLAPLDIAFRSYVPEAGTAVLLALALAALGEARRYAV